MKEDTGGFALARSPRLRGSPAEFGVPATEEAPRSAAVGQCGGLCNRNIKVFYSTVSFNRLRCRPRGEHLQFSLNLFDCEASGSAESLSPGVRRCPRRSAGDAFRLLAWTVVVSEKQWVVVRVDGKADARVRIPATVCRGLCTCVQA